MDALVSRLRSCIFQARPRHDCVMLRAMRKPECCWPEPDSLASHVAFGVIDQVFAFGR